ncbi:MAG: 16S rRNA (cytidine(1402)-2'-O)-methyltransferase [Rickettsiella sp.]|nr:16S rRNA (cytidine(1402)-2'-O)-methyltransferase [Rickettsiella sp.]
MSKTSALYIVATPIGNLGDISARALDTLKSVDCIAAEDTRHSSKLLNYFDINRPIFSLHEHNESKNTEILLNRLQQKQSIALISDAGTPTISDPGYILINKTREIGIPVIPIPGPCALIAALSASGLNCQQFVFAGFLPTKQTTRQAKLKDLFYETRTIIFYEAPHRILDLIEDLITVLGHKRYVVLARELTKKFETIYGNTLDQLKHWLDNNKNQQKGEFVVLVKGNEHAFTHSAVETKRILKLLLDELPIKKAAALASKITHEKKNKLYAQALALTGKTI